MVPMRSAHFLIVQVTVLRAQRIAGRDGQQWQRPKLLVDGGMGRQDSAMAESS